MSKELSLKTQCIPKSSLCSYVTCDTDGIRRTINPELSKRVIIDHPEDKEAVETHPQNDFSMNSTNFIDDIPFKTVEVFLSKREFDDILARERQLVITKELWNKARVPCGFNYATHNI